MASDRQEPSLGILLFVAYRALEQRAHDAVVAAGSTDITLAQARIAARIGPHGTRVSDLAEQARVTKQSAGFLVEQLEAAGYVERVPDPADRRAKLIMLTDLGYETLQAAFDTILEIEAELLSELGAGGLAKLQRVLRRLAPED